MNNIERYLALIRKYYLANDISLDFDKATELRKELRLENDIPFLLYPIFDEIHNTEPGKFFNRNSADEVFQILQSLYTKNQIDFTNAFERTFKNLSSLIRSYRYVVEIYGEFYEASLDSYFKTNIFRIPIFLRITEDLLTNIYRIIRDILQEFTEKNLKSQETLSPLIEILRKNGFIKITEIDVNLRNSLSHGKAINFVDEIHYKFHKNQTEETLVISIWDFDRKIDDLLDLATSGIFALLRILSENSSLITSLYSSNNPEIRETLFYIHFQTKKLNILEILNIGSNKQISISIKIDINNKTTLLMLIFLLNLITYANFGQFDSYFISYINSKSLPGFIKIEKQYIAVFFENELNNIPLKSLENIELMIPDIRDELLNERERKYFRFPQLQDKHWYLKFIEDISIVDYKRIKATLIITKKFITKKRIREFIMLAIEYLKSIYTPENPQIKYPSGETESSVIYLRVFKESTERNKYQLYTTNSDFLCLSIYYKDQNVPKIEHGGVPIDLWNSYKHENLPPLTISWNPYLH